MGITNLVTKISTLMMKMSSSIFDFANPTSFMSAVNTGDSFLGGIVSFFCNLLYFVAKWVLYLTDVIFSFVRQLSGLDMDYTSIETLVSKESDFVFNMLITATETITPIVKALIGLTILLVVFFAILAVIKNMFQNTKNGKVISVKEVFKNMFKAIILLIVTPLIAIIGIIASNTILKTLYNATNVYGATSIGSQMFSASASTANAYRIYAQKGNRIPVTFEFSYEEEIIEGLTSKNGKLDDETKKWLKSNNNRVYKAFTMFKDDKFESFDGLNDIIYKNTKTENNVENYYSVFDTSIASINAIKNGDNNPNIYKRFEAYRSEYLVMADVVDFCIETNIPVYFKTIEEVLDKLASIDNDYLFNSFVSMFGIQFLNYDLKVMKLNNESITNSSVEIRTAYSSYKNLYKGIVSRPGVDDQIDWAVIRYTSAYYDPTEANEPGRKMTIQYNHVKGAIEESAGAKFIVTVDMSKTINGVKCDYFYPLTLGFAIGSEVGFTSEFIQSGQIVSAKGIFEDAKYPTEIKKEKETNIVKFTREYIYEVEVGDPGEVANGSIGPEKDENEGGGIFSFLQTLFTLLNPKIDLALNDDELMLVCRTEQIKINELEAGKLHISYMFSDNMAGGLGDAVNYTTGGSATFGKYGLNIGNLFEIKKVNIYVLFVGAFLLIKILLRALFSLVNRAYELFLIILIYPASCATLPLDESGYKNWLQNFIQRLFSTYGLILGLNFVMMLFPVIQQLEIFSVEEIVLSTPLMRFKNLFLWGAFSGISLEAFTAFLNLIMVIVFELTAFTLLETIPDTINQIAGGVKSESFDPISAIGKTLKLASGITKAVTTAGIGIISTVWDLAQLLIPSKKRRAAAAARLKQKAKAKLKKVTDKIGGFVPGSEIVKSAKDKKFVKDKMKQQKDAMNNLKDTLDNGENDPKKVQEAFNKMLKAQEAANSAISDPRSARKQDEEKKKDLASRGLDENGKANKDDDTDEDISYMDKDDLEDEQSETKKRIKNLENKELIEGKLSKEEKKALEQQKKKLEQIEKALKKKGADKKEYKAAKKTKKKLKKKQKKGTITAEEQAELAQAQDTMLDYKKNKKENKKTQKKKKKEEKEEIKKKEEEAKEYEKTQEKERAFRHLDRKSKRKQKHIMKDIDNEQKDIQKALAKKGINIADLSEDDLKNVEGNYAYTKEQQELLKKYLKNEQDRDYFLNAMTEKAIEENAKKEATYQNKKQKDLAGSHGWNFIANMRRNRKTKDYESTRMSEAKELEDIEAKINAMEGNVDSSNIKEYQKLKERQLKLKQRQIEAEEWYRLNTMSKADLKRERKLDEQRERIDKNALDYIDASGGSYSTKNVQDARNKEYNSGRKKPKRPKY